MAKVAIFEESPLRWLEFDEDTDIALEYLSKEEGTALNKDVEKIVNRTGSDWASVWNRKLGERVVKGWRNRNDTSQSGLTFPNGTPIPFTPENRDMMMKSCREFALFVGENAINAKVFLDLSNKPAEAAEIKNG